jgi:hypothetical protein
VHAPLNLPDAILWGFVATLVLTTLLAGSWGLGLSRMSITFLLGTMFTADRERAKLYGLLVHMANGWLFAFLYVAAFESLHRSTWWIGALIGIAHAMFVLVVAMPMMPSIHPRMASVNQGPTAVRRLQPPGFMALHYGRRTPEVTVLAHAVYGAVLGAFYRLAS